MVKTKIDVSLTLLYAIYHNTREHTTMADGYVYCLSNTTMPGLLKVGMTTRTPEERARELFTTSVGAPFTVEFAKKVRNPMAKEHTLHLLLEQYTERTSRSREFFRVSPEEVRTLFDLMDGEMWVREGDAEEDEAEEDEEAEEEMEPKEPRKKPAGCRDMAKCLTDGQRIRHTIGITKIWTGNYDATLNAIVCNGTTYATPTTLAKAHLKAEGSSRTTANGWNECKCEINGTWVSMKSLKPI